MSLQASIRNKPFDQKSPGHPEVVVLNCHRPTDGHCNFMTEKAQWADSVKIVINQVSPDHHSMQLKLL